MEDNQAIRRYRELTAVFKLLTERDKRNSKWAIGFCCYHYFFKHPNHVYKIIRDNHEESMKIDQPSIIYDMVKAQKYSTDTPWQTEEEKADPKPPTQTSLF